MQINVILAYQNKTKIKLKYGLKMQSFFYNLPEIPATENI